MRPSTSPGGSTGPGPRPAAQALGGTLAGGSSAGLNSFLFSLIDDWTYWYNDPWNALGPWLGGFYTGPSGSMDPVNWAWLNGDPYSYSNWAAGEPNMAGETVLQFFGNGLGNMQPTWNNLGADNGAVKGYIVEWASNPVPLPGALWLLGSGLLGLAGWRRSRQK